MWFPLDGPPYSVTPGSTYTFTLVAPGSMSQADIAAWLSASSRPATGVSAVTVNPGSNWSVVSIHPGHSSGAYRSYAVIATWTGPAMSMGSPSSDPSVPSYATMKLWVADQSQPQETPENAPQDDTPASAPVADDWLFGWFLAGTALSFAGLYLATRTRGTETPLGARRRNVRYG